MIHRLAERGPFRLLRELPQVGFILVAAILCADLAIVGQRVSDDRVASADSSLSPLGSAAPAAAPSGDPEHVVFGSPETGPLPGQATSSYVAGRKAELALRVAGEPSRTAVAVVSFRSAQRPADLAAELPGVSVSAVFVRVQLAGQITPAGVLRTAGLGASLTAGLATVVSSLATDAANNLSQAATVSHLDIPVNLAQKQAFAQEASNEQREITVIKSGGQCVYAAVVTGTYAQLAVVARGRYVRLVDPADDGVTAATIKPHALAPDDTATVGSLETLEGLGAP